MDWFADAWDGYDPGPPIGEQPFVGWDWAYPPVVPEPITLASPAAAPVPAPLAPLLGSVGATSFPETGWESAPRIRIDKPTRLSMDYSDPRYSYDDPLLRIARGQAGTVDPAGPYYGGVSPDYQVFNFDDLAPGAANIVGLRTLPQLFNLKLLTLPNASALLGPAASPAASLSPLLLYGAIALLVVAVLR